MNGDVLITGATGLIGGEIAWRLAREGWRVWCLVRSKSFAEAGARLESRFALSGQICDWSKLVALPGDVTRNLLGIEDGTLRHLRHECRYVVHCAADTSFATHNHCGHVNLAGTRNVLNLCAALGPHVRLFHTSSAVVCRRIARQFHRHLLRRTELHQVFEPLGVRPVVLWAVVRIQDEGMWRMTVSLSVGQISLKRSTMKSPVALPVVTLSQLSAVSGRWRPKGVSLSSGFRS